MLIRNIADLIKKIIVIQLLILISEFSFAQKKTVFGIIPSKIAFTVEEKDLFPEGMAYDSKTKQFFLSSISKFKIIAIDRSGKQTDFISPHQDSMLRSLGLKVDAKLRRLWVVSNSNWGDSVVCGIHIYDIDSKRLIKKLFTTKGRTPVFNDIVLTDDGGAFITDYEGNSIYQIPPDLSCAALFLKSDSLLAGANGITISPDNTTLYVASNSEGIVLVDVITKRIKRIGNPLSIDTKGIDGMILYKNSLIGVVCKDEISEPLIVRYYLNFYENEITSVSIIDYKNPLFAIPTSIVMSGNTLYCLAATWLHLFTLDENNNDPRLGNPMVLQYKFSQKQ